MPPRVLVLVFCCSALEKAKYQLKTIHHISISLSLSLSLVVSSSRVYLKVRRCLHRSATRDSRLFHLSCVAISTRACRTNLDETGCRAAKPSQNVVVGKALRKNNGLLKRNVDLLHLLSTVGLPVPLHRWSSWDLS